jgi:hypothetical protein
MIQWNKLGVGQWFEGSGGGGGRKSRHHRKREREKKASIIPVHNSPLKLTSCNRQLSMGQQLTITDGQF